MLTTSDLDHLARLAKLELTPDQKQSLLPQLNDIITFISQLQSVDTSSVDITTEITGLQNITHPDQEEDSLPVDQALKNAVDVTNNYLRVPAVIDSDDHS